MEKEDLFETEPELARKIASLIVPMRMRAATLVREGNVVRVVFDNE